MKSKLSIKKKIVTVSIDTWILTKNGLEGLGTRYYYNTKNLDWLAFINMNDIKENVNKLFIIQDTDAYLSNLDTKNFNFDEYTLQVGDDLYFFPGTSVPRYKVKEKGDEIGFKTRKTADKANVIILDNSALNKIKSVVNNKPQELKYSDFKKFMEYLRIDINDIFSQEQMDLCETTNTIYAESSFKILNANLRDHHSTNVLDTNHYNNDCDYVPNDKFNEEQKKSLDLLDSLSKNPNIILLDSSAVLNQISNSYIDEKTYNRISQMFESSDPASIELAMELMANMDLKKSLFYILLLCKNYANKIRWSNTYNHSNFKSFRQNFSEFTKFTRDHVFNNNINGSAVISTLGNLKLLKKEHIDYFKEDIKNSFSYGEYNFLFEVTKIDANAKLRKMLIDSSENLKEETNDNNEPV
jgi:hypothetical protein